MKKIKLAKPARSARYRASEAQQWLSVSLTSRVHPARGSCVAPSLVHVSLTRTSVQRGACATRWRHAREPIISTRPTMRDTASATRAPRESARSQLSQAPASIRSLAAVAIE
jgi:hypothetical protein